ncbi:MAG: DUF4250 domain-containing protein [Oscillospiraceae bacterium]|nr:DUF4250 domain-containing protein [Oscillospiraceae bacterium]
MIPNDPMILLSWLNTKLRDEYGSLAALCEDQELDEEELKAKLAAIGFSYDAERNRFF